MENIINQENVEVTAAEPIEASIPTSEVPSAFDPAVNVYQMPPADFKSNFTAALGQSAAQVAANAVVGVVVIVTGAIVTAVVGAIKTAHKERKEKRKAAKEAKKAEKSKVITVEQFVEEATEN